MSQRIHPMDHTSHLLSYLQRKKTASKFIYLSGEQKVNNSMFYSPCTLSVNLSLETMWTFFVQKYNLLCTTIERCGWSTLTLLYFDLQIPGSWETTQEPCREECLDNKVYSRTHSQDILTENIYSMKTIAMTTTSFGNFEIMNSPQKDLAIEALSNTLATPKSAVKKKTASDSTFLMWYLILVLAHRASPSSCCRGARSLVWGLGGWSSSHDSGTPPHISHITSAE